MSIEIAEKFPEHTLLAQIDSAFAIQDYLPRQNCIRLIGVSESSFLKESFNDEAGCQTYMIDLNWEDISSRSSWRLYRLDDPWLLRRRFEEMSNHLSSLDNVWIRITYEVTSLPSRSYAYAAFTGNDPTYLDVKSVYWEHRGPTVNAPVTASKLNLYPTEREDEQVTLNAFHVGQGMCSLFSGGVSGFLIDAGAGTPVTRDAYRAGIHRNGKAFVNELSSLTHSLTNLSVIVSHPDADHWRLLNWDETLLNKINSVFLPAGQPALAFSALRLSQR